MPDSRSPPAQRRRMLAGAAALAATALWRPARAQAFPSRPVKTIVPFAAGGGPDVLARKTGVRLAEALGQSVVVENIVGAGGILAAQNVARAPADGYTLLLGSSAQIVQKLMQPSVKFDPLKDFTPVTCTGFSPALLVVAADAPWKTVQELVAAIRARPAALNYASGGIGSAAHLTGAALEQAMQVQAVHVPYKGSVEIIPSILQGATQFAFPIVSTAIPYVLDGRVRALATSGGQRLAQLPQVPTLREALGKEELALSSWGGVWAPAGTPAEVVDVLFRAYQKTYADPAVRADHEAAGVLVELSASPADFGRFMAEETRKYARIVKAARLVTS
ncbi:MAG: tripartite tricarboxylate transporter substrate-binding protein [Ottowia sp.]|uniref:Bug family tripartite tricarboxylate transporter substrate binding protein n=1 Tax=Ottowia sp. TaxID=1898956 RepID=UPI0039E6858B